MFSIELFWFETLADFRRDTYIYLFTYLLLGGACLNTHVKVRGQFEEVSSLFLSQGTHGSHLDYKAQPSEPPHQAGRATI